MNQKQVALIQELHNVRQKIVISTMPATVRMEVLDTIDCAILLAMEINNSIYYALSGTEFVDD